MPRLGVKEILKRRRRKKRKLFCRRVMMISPKEYLRALVILGFAHAVTDLAMQNYPIALYKSPLQVYTYADGTIYTVWPFYLLAHGMINGAGVWFVTRRVSLGLVDAIAHTVIDFGSSILLYRLLVDQALHLTTKIVLAFMWVLKPKLKKE